MLVLVLFCQSILLRRCIANELTASSHSDKNIADGIYRGCFRQNCLHFDYNADLGVNKTTPESCTISCKDYGYSFAAVYNTSKCSCACEMNDSCPFPLDDNVCGSPCRANASKACGSFVAANLYKVRNPKGNNCSIELSPSTTTDSTSASPSATNTTNEYETEISEMSTKVSSTAGKAEIPNSVISTDTRFPTSSPTSPENTRQSTATDMKPPSRVSFVIVTSSLGATIMVLVLILIITCVRYKRRIRRLKWQNQLAQQMVKLSQDDSAPYHTLNSSSRLHDNKSEVKEKTASAAVSGALTSTPSQDRSPRRTGSRAESADSVVDVDNDDDSDSDSDHGYIDMRSVLGRVSAKRDNNEGDGGDYVNFPFKPK